MNGRFAGRSALVTGAAHGIGAAIAARLAEEGAHVVVADIDEPGAAATADAIRAQGRHARSMALDVADPLAWRATMRAIEAETGGLDVLVNNAYFLVRSPAGDLAEADWDRQIAVDLSSVYHSVRACIASLQARRGVIVNVGSVHALVGVAGHPAYAASKGGMVALTRQLAVEYGSSVRVNAVLPGPILTRTWDHVDPTGLEAASSATALLRMGEPLEVASAVAFLASDDASYVTATTLLVDGGWTARKEP